MNSQTTTMTQSLSPGERGMLADILMDVPYTVLRKGPGRCEEMVVTTLQSDSRAVVPGALFFAVTGMATDGHLFVGDAIRRGCAAVVVETGSKWSVPEAWQGCLIEVDDSRKAYAEAAANFYGRPARRLKLIGITGTNGKTTVSYLVEEILVRLGHQVGVIGTVNYRYPRGGEKVVMPSPFTTPEPMRFQALLFEMAQAGVNYLIMEVSSHALTQARIGKLLFDVAVFTNLSHDHLDYHRTMEEYFLAKTTLFADHLKSGGQAVVSHPQQPADSEDWSGRIQALCHQRSVPVVSSGKREDAHVRLLDYSFSPTATRVRLVIAGETLELTSALVGHFNIDNLLTSIAVCRALGLAPKTVLPHLAEAGGAPGRLQRVSADDGTEFQRPAVFVDYAHTPDALRQVLAALGALPHRDLFCVFGCGGDRDNEKRPVMGRFAGTLAEVVVVTDDNPRSEEPADIRRQIIPGVEGAGLTARDPDWLHRRSAGERGFVEIGAREEAIARTIRAAGKNDIVLIAGKGHEQYQLGRSGKRFFDDCLQAESALLSWNSQSLALATGGELLGADANDRLLGAVSTDTRTIGAGDIFVALRGERFDGHDFLATARDQGAGCLVVEHGAVIPTDMKTPRVEVPDTLQALADLARFKRRLIARRSSQVVAAITGSCGKTTVKEMTVAILRRRWPAGPDYPEDCVLATKGNLNNLIGLPLTLLPIDLRHRAAVLEMGMNCPGEIDRMARAAQPDVCCITNVHSVHLEGLGTVEGVAAAKEELFAAAPQKAVLVVNLDDRFVPAMASKYPNPRITFTATTGAERLPADLYVSGVQAAQDGVITFVLHRGGEQEEIHLSTVGEHNVANAVAAAAIATAAGATLAEIAAGLADFRPADKRLVLTASACGMGIINDTYNANPVSMAAALNTLVRMGSGKTAALLGDMLEMGAAAPDAHHRLGVLAGELGLEYLGAVGEFRELLVRGAREAGMASEKARAFADKESAASWIEELQQQGELGECDWLLVKASRGLKMETIVGRLTETV